MTVHLSVALDEDRHSRLQEIAEHEALSVDALVDRLIQDRLDYDGWYLRKVDEALEDVRRGRVRTGEEVREHMAALRAELQAKA